MDKKNNGSVLIISLMIASIFGFVVASFLRSTVQELKIAEANFNQKSLVNITHTGSEIALRTLNENDWTGWYNMWPWMIESLYDVDRGNGNTATMYFYVYDQMPNPPRIYSIIYYYLANGEMIQKNFYSDLRKRSVFPNGITTHDDIVFADTGVPTTVSVDSYTSDPGVNLGIYDPFFNRSDNGSLVGGKVRSWELAVGEIYGYVSTWVEPQDIGADGKIYGVSTPAGIDIDESRIADGFEPTFLDVPLRRMIICLLLDLPNG